MSARTLSLTQAAIAGLALVGITVLAAIDKVSSDVIVSIYSAVIGAGLAGGGALTNAKARAIERNGDSE